MTFYSHPNAPRADKKGENEKGQDPPAEGAEQGDQKADSAPTEKPPEPLGTLSLCHFLLSFPRSLSCLYRYIQRFLVNVCHSREGAICSR